MKTAVRYQLRAQGRYFVPGPNMFGGITGRSPGERPHYGIAGESPTFSGTFPGKRDIVWTQGQSSNSIFLPNDKVIASNCILRMSYRNYKHDNVL